MQEIPLSLYGEETAFLCSPRPDLLIASPPRTHAKSLQISPFLTAPMVQTFLALKPASPPPSRGQ